MAVLAVWRVVLVFVKEGLQGVCHDVADQGREMLIMAGLAV